MKPIPTYKVRPLLLALMLLAPGAHSLRAAETAPQGLVNDFLNGGEQILPYAKQQLASRNIRVATILWAPKPCTVQIGSSAKSNGGLRHSESAAASLLLEAGNHSPL
jgi:hypothetical protein